MLWDYLLTFFGAGAIGLAVLLIAWNMMSKEEEHLADRARMPWKLLVPGYTFFATIAVGLAIFAGASYLGYAPGDPKLLAWLSFASLVPAWALVYVDLGRPDKVLAMVSGFNKSSRIAWNLVLYALLTLSLFWLIFSPSTCSAIAVLAFAVLLETNLAMAFGTTKVPGWEGASKPAEFVSAALLLGGALTQNWPVVTVSALALLLLDFWEIYHVKFEDPELMKAVPWKGVALYWILLLLAAFVSPADPVIGGFFAFVGVLAQKVVSGYWPQRARLLKGYYKAFLGERASFASASEIMAFFAAFLIWVAMMALGIAFLG